MGSCLRTAAQVYQQQHQSKQLKQLREKILAKFAVGKQLKDMLDGECYTQNQAKELAKVLIKGAIHLQQPESQTEKKKVEALFDKNNIDKIINGQLFYYEMLDKLSEIKISQSSRSRIYHTIANLKKEKQIKENYKNKWEIECIKDNGYNRLSESQLQQVIKYQTIADKTREFGQRIGFKYQSIKKQSEKMTQFLEEFMSKYIETINLMKYNLSQDEVMKMASIASQACNFNDDGVYILLVYLVKSCKRLQQQEKQSIQKIDQLVKKAVESVYKKYPAGKGISQEKKHLESALKNLQIKKQKQNKFKHEIIKLAKQNKQAYVENIIMQYAKLADNSKQDFQQLVKKTCLEKCVFFKINLKYYPKNPNKKALIRIKEKMLLKDVQWKKECQGSINKTLEKEQTVYRNIIDFILNEKDTIQFNISDMVRGKCVFLQIEDIIQTVNSIKKFVKDNPKFKIEQVESRFNNKIPISDVTLKIIIDDIIVADNKIVTGKQIVAELQLTIQTNVAAYSFHHKMYQLQRNKVFSKLKITHNYFQELKKDFCQLAKKAIQLKPNKSIISQSIWKYFELDFNFKSFSQILQETIQENQKELKQLVISVDPSLQDLIMVSFNISINLWDREIGKIINKSLKNENNSPKLKSVVLSIFLDQLQLTNESQNMQQLGIIQKQLKNTQKNFLKFNEYQVFRRKIKEYFIGVNNFSKQYFLSIYNLTQFTQEILNLWIIWSLSSTASQSKLSELSYELYQIFESYSSWISDQLNYLDKEKNSNKILLNEIEIIKAQQMLEKQKPNEAKVLLQNTLKYFKSREQYSKVMQCQILQAQCFIKNNKMDLKDYIQNYNDKIKKQSQILGIELAGDLYADSLWRISKYLWPKFQGTDRVQLLKYFTSLAIQQMSRCKGKQFIYALMDKWKQFDQLQKKPQIKINPNIRYAILQSLQRNCCQYLIKARWSNITAINLTWSNIGDVGCQHLIKADWKNITTLNLRNNQIKAQGCQHLSKADWKKITTLNLQVNNIGDKGCQHLSKADWMNITTLDLYQNNIGDLGCYHLSRGNWKNITKLNLRNNNIEEKGCQHLSKADWKNIASLDLYQNNIGEKGCYHLSRADWKNITTLSLDANRIGDKGCEHLSKADWKNMTLLNLKVNLIGAVGCEYLSKADWKNITTLNLQRNKIGNAGCQDLSKTDWKNITTLDLSSNNIEEKGCQYLIKADWKNITILNLYGNKVGNLGCQYLYKTNWINLKEVNLMENNISQQSKDSIRSIFKQKGIQIQI